MIDLSVSCAVFQPDITVVPVQSQHSVDRARLCHYENRDASLFAFYIFFRPWEKDEH